MATETTGDKFLRTVRTYVLRAGRMTEAQKHAYEEHAKQWCIPFTHELLDFHGIFSNDAPVVIEIGFGMGQATALIARDNPSINYIGIEVHRAGVGRLLSEIERMGLSNLRIIEYDALEALETMIPDNAVSAFHIFFPDPWPKKKHHKRRLVQRPITDLFTRKLVSGGYVYMVTDWEPYAEHALEELTATGGLTNRYAGYAPHQPWRPETRFEQKGLQAQHGIYELMFTKTLEE